MDNLVLANLAARPIRSLTSVVGIALGVVLILVTVGLARGMLLSAGEREGNLRAELVFLPPSGFGAGISTSPLTLPIAYAQAIAKMPGVAATTPVARYVRTGARGIGFELIEGVELDGDGALGSYPNVTGLTIAEGRLPEGPYELIVDRQRATDPETHLGAKLELLGQTFEVVGVYEPEVGARMKIPLETMQELLGASERASWILVHTETVASVETVAGAIEAQFPGNQIVFTRDIPGMWAQGIPSLKVFLNIVIALAVFISTLTIFLALYTAVTERTRGDRHFEIHGRLQTIHRRHHRDRGFHPQCSRHRVRLARCSRRPMGHRDLHVPRGAVRMAVGSCGGRDGRSRRNPRRPLPRAQSSAPGSSGGFVL